MGMKSFLFALMTILSGALPAWSTTLFLETEAGSGYGAGHLGVEWNKTKDFENLYLVSASASAGGSQSRVEDSNGNITTIKTQDADAGLGVGFNDMFELHLSGFTTRTPEVKYQQTGSLVELSFRHTFKAVEKITLDGEGEENFAPGFSVGIGSGSSHIRQTVSFTILNTTVERDIDLDQKEVSGFISLSPLAWLRLRLSGSNYSYSKSKSDLQTAFANRFLNYYTTDLVSTIAGLPENTVALQGIFVLNPDWDFELKGSNTKMIVDDSISRRGRVLVTRYYNEWSFAGGVSRSETTQAKEFSGLFNISYLF